MTDKIARVCDVCGKSDVLDSGSDSNGMIMVQSRDCYLLLMRDLRGRENARPTFSLANKHYHPECLIKALQDWLKKAK